VTARRTVARDLYQAPKKVPENKTIVNGVAGNK
jgi:hypothetical protein